LRRGRGGRRRRRNMGFWAGKKPVMKNIAVLKRRVNEKIAIGLLVVVSVSRSWCIVFGLPW
jgi:hypothetical protein